MDQSVTKMKASKAKSALQPKRTRQTSPEYSNGTQSHTNGTAGRGNTVKGAASKGAARNGHAQSGHAVLVEDVAGQNCFFAHKHMRHMAPESVQNEAIVPQAAIMCHIMLLHSVLERSANRVVEEHGLTFPQWMALGCIGHCGEQGIRHSELGNRLMLSKAPVTGVVDRLERGGYVRRFADDKDRRVSRVTITPEGDAAWKQVRQTLREHSINACATLSSEDQTMFLSFLSRLLEDVSQSDPILSTPLDD
jgi:DNA-binding MarR family transcriptional regulator